MYRYADFQNREKANMQISTLQLGLPVLSTSNVSAINRKTEQASGCRLCMSRSVDKI